MTIHTDRIVLVFPIAPKNRPAAASLQTLEITESGREFEDIVPLNPALVNDYATEFNLGTLVQVETLEANLAAAANQLEANTNAKTALESQVETLTTALATANATIAQLQNPDVISPDENEIDWNPRHIAPEKFVKRFNGSQAYKIFTSTDEVLIGGRELLRHYIVNNYHIDLDDPQVIELTSHMLTTTPPILTPEERVDIRRDSSSSERYQPVA